MRRSRLVVVLLAAVMTASACASGHGASTVRGGAGPSPAADRFLARYVTNDGRVIRRDQGGDIVSEGQAYGMLIAELAARPALTRTIWRWTIRHLGRPDGLFSWHATGSGDVEDPQSATDADILIAYALGRYRGPDAAEMLRAGRRVAEAVLADEALPLPDGTLLPAAGPWATSTSPPTVNPSYLMPGVFRALARQTGDARWARTASAAVDLVRNLTDGGRRLPPDWATLSGARLAPAPAPGGGAGIEYGLDAARVPLWFATACDGAARRLAGAWWRSLRGDPGESPVTLLAGAAAATASGDRGAARSLRIRAERLAAEAPTYYGDAWAALGPALLDGRLVPCAGTGP